MEQEYYERSFSPQRPRSQLSSEYSGASTAHPVEWNDDWIHREEEFRDTINALQSKGSVSAFQKNLRSKSKPRNCDFV